MTDRETGTAARPRRQRFRALRVIAGSLVILFLLIAATGLLLAHDRDLVRTAIEKAITAVSGHPFKIEGEFHYRLGGTTRFRADKIRWRTSTADGSRPLLEIEHFSAGLNLWSLIARPVLFTEVGLDQGTVWLRWDDDGGFDWAGESTTQSGRRLTAQRAQLPLVVESGSLRNLAIRLSHPAMTGPFEILLTELRHQRDTANRLAFNGMARIEDRTLILDGRIGPFAGLAAGGPVDFDLSLLGPLASLAAHGSGGSIAQLQDLHLVARLQAPSATDLARRLKLPLDSEGAVDLEVLVDTREGRLDASAVGAFGEVQIDAGVKAESLDSLAGLEAHLRSKGPSAQALGIIAGQAGLPDAPYELEGSARRTAQGLELQRLHFETSTLSVEASGIARAVEDLRDIDLELSAQGSDVGILAAMFGLERPKPQPFRLQASVAGQGRERDDQVDAELVVGDARARLTGWLSEALDLAGSRFKIDLATPRPDRLAALLPSVLPPRLRSLVPEVDFNASAELHLTATGLEIKAARAESGGNTLAFEGRVDTDEPGARLTGDLSLKGKDLGAFLGDSGGFADSATGEFNLKSHVRLVPGAMHLEMLQLTAAEVQIDGTLSLSGGASPGVEFDLTGTGEDLGTWLPQNAFYRPAEVPFRLVARGKGTVESITMEELEATLGAARLAFSGDLGLQPRPAFEGFRLQASGPRLSELGGFGEWRLTERPFSLAATLQGDADEKHVENLVFVSGDNNLNGRITVKHEARPVVEVELESSRLAVDELLVAVTRAARPPSGEQSGERLFSDQPLPFELLERFDGEIRVEVDSLLSHQRLWRNVQVNATIEQGALEIRQAGAEAARGKVQLSGSVKPTAAGRQVVARITAADAMLASAQMTPEELDRLPRHAIDARLSATGSTPHELAASLNGFVWIIGGEGEGPRAKIGPLFGDFLSELGSAVNQVETEKGTARVDCDGIYLEIDQGKVRTAPAIVLQTEHVVVFAVGTADLATEEIDVLFETTPLRGIGISLGDLTNPFTKLTGTLRHPRISLSPEGTLLQGGAAVATSGLSIVVKSLWKRWFGSRQICEKVANKALALRSERDPTNVPDLASMMAGTGAVTDPGTAVPETAPAGTKPRSTLDELHDMMD